MVLLPGKEESKEEKRTFVDKILYELSFQTFAQRERESRASQMMAKYTQKPTKSRSWIQRTVFSGI